jgi:alpha,alpha-trehalose phosphorylase
VRPGDGRGADRLRRPRVRVLRDALFVDLADTHGNTSDGIHIASAGGVWGTIAFGFAGMYDTGTSLRFAPRLPTAWQRLTFRRSGTARGW